MGLTETSKDYASASKRRRAHPHMADWARIGKVQTCLLPIPITGMLEVDVVTYNSEFHLMSIFVSVYLHALGILQQ